MSARLSRRTFLLGTGMAAVGTGLSGCGLLDGSSSNDAASATQLGVVRLGMQATTVAASAKLAERKGYFSKEGIKAEFTIFEAGPKAVPSLLGDEVDMCVLNYVSLFQGLEKKTFDLVVVVDANEATRESCQLLVSNDIKAPQDLIGKQIGIHAFGSVNELLVRATLADNQIDPNSVKYAAVQFPDVGQSIANGQIAGGVVIEPYLTQAQQRHGLNSVIPIVAGSTAQFPLAGWVAKRTWVEKNPEKVKAFQRAMIPAQTDASNRNELAGVLPDLVKINKDQVMLLHLDTFPTSNSATRLQRVPNLMNAMKALGQQFDAKTLILPTPSVA
ncbi:ABC transporter substrate-binding protein [Kibdelosporangium aridum]|uniref:NitT/TauT family transport system substrate-binding protein n=1 Tax=Kibdelosporangium aridum TaxID=2030 RepID=A0A1W2FWJ7_KIBAR|nr:ABC transporter substrate-binding protein [Kibdelosporangium aridum]SMD26347.1 NitT/TauT family transport system substrate-binding protein [Kibdelosporangium aridum]